MDAVVMAAGEGRRLRPLTERWPKPILPIDGRPVVATLIRELAAAGFERVHVVTGHLAERVERLLGDGSAFGVHLAYARQPEPLGSADAVRHALDAGARPPLLATAADTVYAPGDVARARSAWESAGAAGGLGVRRLAPPDLGHQARVRADDGLVVELGGTGSTDERGTLTGAPLWFLDEGLAAVLADLPGPPYELAAAFTRAIAAGERVAALPLGRTRDLTRPEDVVARNFPYLWSRD